MTIAVSKASGSESYERYGAWLRTYHPEMTIVDCSLIDMERLPEVMAACSGLVLSGGADVQPERYGAVAEGLPCSPDPERDAREFRLLDLALERTMPVLGICRGMQVLNVHGGGTLVIDIPAQVPEAGEHRGSEGDARHTVEIASDSVLKKLVRRSEGVVNSSHHQAVDVLAPGFTVAAAAEDGIVEAIERDPEHGKSVVLGVQWHPERMEPDNPLAKNILHYFCFECECYDHLLRSNADA